MKNETENNNTIHRKINLISIITSCIIVLSMFVSFGTQFYEEIYFYSEELNQVLLEDVKKNIIIDNGINTEYFEKKDIEFELYSNKTIFSKVLRVQLYSSQKNVEVEVKIKVDENNNYYISQISYPSKAIVIARTTFILFMVCTIISMILAFIIDIVLLCLSALIMKFHKRRTFS